MDIDSDTRKAQLFIDASTEALKKGDRLTARRCAEQAAALAPQTEQPWLLLAFLSKPRAAQYYLERALEVNPTSPRARAAMDWLKAQSAQGTSPTVPPAPGPRREKKPRRSGSTRSLVLRFSVMVVAVVVLLAGGVYLSGAAHPPESQDSALARAVQAVLNAAPTSTSSPAPSLTWTASPTATPTTVPTATNTDTPIPTHTVSPVPTSTNTPTAKPSPTPKPSPVPPTNTPVGPTVYSVAPGDTLNSIAQRYSISLQSLIAANNLANPSFIKAGQQIKIPGAGQTVALQPTVASVPPGPTGSGKEILVDISEQHTYAYQDNKLIFSFVSSTGTGNSTRIGTFKVLDKIPKAYSYLFNIWMPYWLGIYYSGTLENGIHGLPLLMNGVELWGSLLGQPATYGCIEFKTSEAKQLYDWADIGTPVIIRP